MNPEPSEDINNPAAMLEAAWQRYRAKSPTPALLNYEDFCAGYGAAQGGLEQFMRMKSRITELEARIAQYERQSRTHIMGIPQGTSHQDFMSHTLQRQAVYSALTDSAG